MKPSPSNATCVLVGDSPQMVAVRRALDRVAGSRLPVLIEGETGTGKAIVAQLLHAGSRSRGRLTTINMAALPLELAETELFGSLPGAFTGASRRTGLVHAAADGTLYLDEACSTPLALQSKLLRSLETGLVRRVGSTTEEPVAFRLVLSTQERATQLVETGRWRADFYYRVAGIVLHLPPLRARKADLRLLTEHLLALQNEGPIADDALADLEFHDWPGNVRELKQVLLRACVEAGGAPISRPHVRAALHEQRLVPAPSGSGSLADVQWQHVEGMLRDHGFHVESAARALGISRATLYRWLRARSCGERVSPVSRNARSA
jgi:transcriptional regulator, propionate catabolism operon regulatory protein